MEARQGGDGLPAPFTTARPDARGAGMGILKQNYQTGIYAITLD